MDITPTIRTPQTAFSRVDYAEYLKTATWRTKRNAALREAHYRCSKCGGGRQLEVHHKTYERLGREWASDLEVLCKGCHEGEHVRQMHDYDAGRLYLKLVTEVIRDRAFDSFADLVSECRERCARLKIPYDAHQVDKAVGLLSGSAKFAPSTRPSLAESTAAAKAGRVITTAESAECLKRVASGLVMRTMPALPTGPIEIRGPVPREDWGDHDRY